MRLTIAAILVASVGIAAPAEEVSLETPTGTLHGTLLIPTTPAPVALIIAGSGTSDRNGNAGDSFLTDSLLRLAEALEESGIASLRYDKRGVGESFAAGPNERDLRFQMYVDDAAAWAEQLLADPRFTSVTIVGHSEGALIGTFVAQRVGIRSLVLLAGPGRPVGDIFLEQLQNRVSPALLQRSREIVAALNAGQLVPSVPFDLFLYFRPSVQPYLISLFQIDPAREISQVNAPVLIVQGTSDIQVRVIDAKLLSMAAPNDNLIIIEGMNHVLKQVGDSDEAQRRSYIDPSIPIDPTLARSVAQFIKPVLRRRAVAVH